MIHDKLQVIVDIQAESETLWTVLPTLATPTVIKLQAALRALHKAIEERGDVPKPF
jgi:hypothetical protein